MEHDCAIREANRESVFTVCVDANTEMGVFILSTRYDVVLAKKGILGYGEVEEARLNVGIMRQARTHCMGQ